MDRLQLAAVLSTLINDNVNEEISAQDVREALLKVFDESIVNGGLPTAAQVKLSYEHNPDTNAFTDALLTKLNGVSGDHFKGVHVSIVSLTTAYPTPKDGDYAFVRVGGEEHLYFAEGSTWHKDDSQATTHATLSASQIKRLYEGNVNTNEFTDTEKSKLKLLTASGLFKGVFRSLNDLEVSVPAAHKAVQDGSYAFVTSSGTEVMYIIDNTYDITSGTTGKWVSVGAAAGGATLDAATIKNLYESNVDTEGLTAAMAVVVRSLGTNTALTTDPVTMLSKPLGAANPTPVPTDQVAALASKNYMTVGQVFKALTQLHTSGLTDKGVVSKLSIIVDTGIYHYVPSMPTPLADARMPDGAKPWTILAMKDQYGNLTLEATSPGIDGVRTGYLKSSDMTNGFPWSPHITQSSGLGDVSALVGHAGLSAYLKGLHDQIAAMKGGSSGTSTTGAAPAPAEIVIETEAGGKSTVITGTAALLGDGAPHRVQIVYKAGVSAITAPIYVLDGSAYLIIKSIGGGNYLKEAQMEWIANKSIITVHRGGHTADDLVLDKVEYVPQAADAGLIFHKDGSDVMELHSSVTTPTIRVNTATNRDRTAALMPDAGSLIDLKRAPSKANFLLAMALIQGADPAKADCYLSTDAAAGHKTYYVMYSPKLEGVTADFADGTWTYFELKKAT